MLIRTFGTKRREKQNTAKRETKMTKISIENLVASRITFLSSFITTPKYFSMLEQFSKV
jgi:hypothetical protein